VPGTGSIQLARVFGIRIGVDGSWFVILFFFIFFLSGSFKAALEDSSDTVAYVTAVASAMLFFASLILHELGHALVARRQGIHIAGIDLWFFGGIAKMSRDTDSPGAEFKVAIAGPLVTLAVILLCGGAGLAIAGGEDFARAAVFDRDADATAGLLLLGWLTVINAFLLAFNLIPAFPLDGGRIARAIAWRISGSRLRATRFAAALGQGFSYVLIALGILALLYGAWLSGIWAILIGFFLGQAARGAVAQTAFSERIGNVTVADIMDREPVAVPAALPAARAQDEFFLRYRWPWFPVVDPYGRFVGVVRQERVEGAMHSGDGTRAAGELMDVDGGDWRVGQDAPLESLLGSEGLRRIGALMAVDPDGVLRGVVTIDQVRRALQMAATPGGAAP
jgi:Zn-dependent protease